MTTHFERIRNYILDLDFDIAQQDETTGILLINKEQEGIYNLVVGIFTPIVIIEQHLFDLKEVNGEVFEALLRKNRDIVHGAFALDESGKRVLFRDTLQLENLDYNELEGSLNSLSLLLSEYGDEIIKFSKN